MAKSIAIWGHRPPPVGGVSRSVVLLEKSLKAQGYPAKVVDVGSRGRAAITAMTPAVLGARLHVFNVGSFRSAVLLSRIARVLPGFTALYLHGMRFVGEYEAASTGSRRRIEGALTRFSGIWVTNEILGDLVRRAAVGTTPSLVSPFPAASRSTPSNSPHAEERPVAAVVGAYEGLDLYGVDIAVAALELCREGGAVYTLDVVLYGPEKPGKQRIRTAAEESSWIRVQEELEPEELTDLLSRSDLLLRPTEQDGDSLLVREALAAGCRVIASDVVPRPVGVEVAPRRTEAFADAIRDGGSPSDGKGLGMPADLKVQEVLGGR